MNRPNRTSFAVFQCYYWDIPVFMVQWIALLLVAMVADNLCNRRTLKTLQTKALSGYWLLSPPSDNGGIKKEILAIIFSESHKVVLMVKYITLLVIIAWSLCCCTTCICESNRTSCAITVHTLNKNLEQQSFSAGTLIHTLCSLLL